MARTEGNYLKGHYRWPGTSLGQVLINLGGCRHYTSIAKVHCNKMNALVNIAGDNTIQSCILHCLAPLLLLLSVWPAYLDISLCENDKGVVQFMTL